MKRFLFVLLVVGVTRACQPVPAPSGGFAGYTVPHKQRANIKLVTIVDYDKEKVPQYMGYFPATRVSQWMKEVVEKGQYYKNAPVECIHPQTTPTEPKTTAEETATATTAQSRPVVPEAATEEEETHPNTEPEPKTTAEETATATTAQSRPVVSQWMKEVVEKGQYYKKAPVECIHNQTTPTEPKTTAEETATATTAVATSGARSSYRRRGNASKYKANAGVIQDYRGISVSLWNKS
ncbi:hypothetical protein OSTOST_09759 [Ostertagia ostertagi]